MDVAKATPIVPPRSLPRFSVRFFLISLILVCLVPGLIGAVMLVHHEYWASRTTFEKNALQTTRALTQAVDSHLYRAQAVAQSLSASDALRRKDFAALYLQARDFLALNPLGNSIALSDSTGQQIINLSREFGQPLPKHGSPEQIRQVVETGQPSISDLFKGAVAQQLLVTVDVPVRLNGEVEYVLTAVLRPVIFENLLKAQGLPPKWIAGILDSKGVFVVRSHARDQFIGKTPSEKLSRQINVAMEGAFEAVTPDGIPVLNIYSRSPLTGWTVVLSIPQQELEAQYERPLQILVLGMLAVFALGVGLAWWVGNKIAFSVRALTRPAHALGSSEAVQFPQVEFKEAGEVACALINASTLLQKRTEALQITNETLLAKEAELAQAHRLAKFGSWYWNLMTGEIIESDSLQQMYGREIISSFSKTRGTLLTIDSWERVNSAIQTSMRTGSGYDLELQVIHDSGYPIWVNLKGETVRNDEGEVSALRGSIQDITERKLAQQELLKAETRFRSTFEQAAVGMALVGLDGNWMQLNDRFCEIVGYTREALQGLSFQDITYTDDLTMDLALVERLLSDKIPNYSMEKRYVRQDGTLTWVNLTVALMRTPEGQPDYFVSVIEDIQHRKETEAALASERESRQQQLEQLVMERTEALQAAIRDLDNLARRDALTGLQNRLSVNERLRAEFLRMKRTGRAYTTLLMDIDHFKLVNDTFGHETGDQVLKLLAEVLHASVRATDFVARFGGEEFLALLPETDAKGALSVAEKIRASVAKQDFPAVKRLTISIGVARANPEDANEEEAVRRADMALYEAKEHGRNKVCLI